MKNIYILIITLSLFSCLSYNVKNKYDDFFYTFEASNNYEKNIIANINEIKITIDNYKNKFRYDISVNIINNTDYTLGIYSLNRNTQPFEIFKKDQNLVYANFTNLENKGIFMKWKYEILSHHTQENIYTFYSKRKIKEKGKYQMKLYFFSLMENRKDIILYTITNEFVL